MESYHLEGFPAECSAVHMALFHHVTNAADLRRRLIEVATALGTDAETERDRLDYAFIDAGLVVSREQLHVAIYQALQALAQNRLKTKTVHSEILLALCPSNNISDAIRRFGISATSTSAIMVRIGAPVAPGPSSNGRFAAEQRLVDSMSELVKGDMTSFDLLSDSADWARVKKLYKLNDVSLLSSGGQQLSTEEATSQGRRIHESMVVSTVAAKTAT